MANHTTYLARAAELLEKAARDNETMHDHNYTSGRRARNEGRVRLATLYAGLAAIDKGIAPVGLLDDITRAAAVAERR